MWSSGALNQQDWSTVQFLLPRLLISGILAAFLIRPLTLLGLDDGVARNLGLGLSLARLSALGLAIIFSAMLVNAVGVIGFIGLFAPLLAKFGGTALITTSDTGPYCRGIAALGDGPGHHLADTSLARDPNRCRYGADWCAIVIVVVASLTQYDCAKHGFG